MSRNRPTTADVGIVANDPRDPFVDALRLELEQLGFSVVRERDLSPTSNEVALVRVAETSLELYEVGREGVLHTRETAAAKNDPLEAAEAARAPLLPLVTPERRVPAEPPGPAAVVLPATDTARVEATREQRTLEVSAGAGAFFGKTTPGLDVTLHVGARTHELGLPWASAGAGMTFSF